MTSPTPPHKKLTTHPALLTWTLTILAVALTFGGCEITETGGGNASEEDTADTSGSTSGDTSGSTSGNDTSGGGCDGSRPSGADFAPPLQSCEETGCPAGQVCRVVEDGPCVPSSCVCQDGQMICTADCRLPTACVPDEPSACGANPAESCLDTGCPADEYCVPSNDDGCRPSTCICDEASGGWACTDDCQPLMECRFGGGGACTTPDPSQTCEDTGCPRGEQCIPSNDAVCVPSTCVCDEMTGGWACTEDCGQPMVCSPGGSLSCDGPNPAENCLDTGCAAGQLCVLAPTDECVPSECFCDTTSGSWTCTRDCDAAMVCEESTCGAYPGACQSDEQCGDGFVCDPQPWDAPPVCCQCEGESWFCTDDCMQTTGCKPAPACEGPNPAQDCEDTGCPRGEECVPSDADVCVPSACGCDAATGSWTCTADCGQPMVCAPINTGCDSPDPSQNCEDTGCPAGQECLPSPLTVCVPSSCVCDPTTGGWACTDDCNQPMVCGVP